MKARIQTIALTLSLIAVPAFAGNVVFSCTASNQKPIQLTEEGNQLKFLSAISGKTMTFPKGRGTYESYGDDYPWNTETFVFSNGGYSYRVFYLKNVKTKAIEAGEDVLLKGNIVKKAKCSNKAKIINNLGSQVTYID